MKKLGFGLMRLPLTDPNNETSIDIELTKKMVDTFIERGFTYFDTAWMYCGFKSEDAVKVILTDRHPRDSYTLATKLNAMYFEDEKGRDEMFETQLEKTGVQYFDYYLLHGVGPTTYDKYKKFDCFNFIKEKKALGLAKKIGFSFHGTADLLDEVLTENKGLDFVQLQINYLDWDSEDVQSRKCYEVAVKHGLPVVVMEPVKGGTLSKLPEKAEKAFKEYRPDLSISSWAIRFVASLDNVFMVLSGMSNMEQMLDNTDYMMDFTPLDEKEHELINQAVEAINNSNSIPCTACSYCTDGCPAKIAIPKYFSLYNDKEDKKAYNTLAQNFGKASDCIECGQCEDSCPQHLPIIEHLKQVAEKFEQ